MVCHLSSVLLVPLNDFYRSEMGFYKSAKPLMKPRLRGGDALKVGFWDSISMSNLSPKSEAVILSARASSVRLIVGRLCAEFATRSLSI